MDPEREVDEYTRDLERLRRSVHAVIVGQESVVEASLLALLAGGHLLMEGVPGTGKTLLVRALAAALEVDFKRVQCTPDLMPADVMGTWVVSEADGKRDFTFRKGPVFTNLLLADEVNRATPRTQSALLEAMQEGQVTAGGETFPLPDPFVVLATVNPIEMEGTFPLPEAQLDRFLLQVQVPNPPAAQIETILDRTTGEPAPLPASVLSGSRVRRMQRLLRAVPLGNRPRAWIARLVEATRPESPLAGPLVRRFVRFGASPRGAQALALGGKHLALAGGRAAVVREDLERIAHAALRHRLVLTFEAEAEGVSADRLVDEALARAQPT